MLSSDQLKKNHIIENKPIKPSFYFEKPVIANLFEKKLNLPIHHIDNFEFMAKIFTSFK